MSEHHATIDWQRSSKDFTYDSYNRAHDWCFVSATVTASAATPEATAKRSVITARSIAWAEEPPAQGLPPEPTSAMAPALQLFQSDGPRTRRRLADRRHSSSGRAPLYRVARHASSAGDRDA